MPSTCCGRKKVASVSGDDGRREPGRGSQPGRGRCSPPRWRSGAAPAPAHRVGLPRRRPDHRPDPGPDEPGRGAPLGVGDARAAGPPGRPAAPSDDELMAGRRTCPAATWRAGPVPASVRWVTNQGSRWGSCTPADRTIRLSTRLQGMPSWVVDYVLVHELAHLLEAGHGPAFWELVDRYPRRAGPRLPRGGVGHRRARAPRRRRRRRYRRRRRAAPRSPPATEPHDQRLPEKGRARATSRPMSATAPGGRASTGNHATSCDSRVRDRLGARGGPRRSARPGARRKARTRRRQLMAIQVDRPVAEQAAARRSRTPAALAQRRVAQAAVGRLDVPPNCAQKPPLRWWVSSTRCRPRRARARSR